MTATDTVLSFFKDGRADIDAIRKASPLGVEATNAAIDSLLASGRIKRAVYILYLDDAKPEPEREQEATAPEAPEQVGISAKNRYDDFIDIRVIRRWQCRLTKHGEHSMDATLQIRKAELPVLISELEKLLPAEARPQMPDVGHAICCMILDAMKLLPETPRSIRLMPAAVAAIRAGVLKEFSSSTNIALNLLSSLDAGTLYGMALEVGGNGMEFGGSVKPDAAVADNAAAV